jgi:two-component system, chemotaxis family, protein-glutamate methylesterase/glutaminase
VICRGMIQETEKIYVVIGASAGGVHALRVLMRGFTRCMDATLFIALHHGCRVKGEENLLVQLLKKDAHCADVKEAEDGEGVKNNTVYIAPHDRHLVIRNGCVQLDDSAPVNFVRPSVDVLFRSAVNEYGKNVIGVILSGSGSDGAEGVKLVKEGGGVTITQNKDTAEYFGMPGAAIETGCVDHIESIEDIAALVEELVYGR